MTHMMAKKVNRPLVRESTGKKEKKTCYGGFNVWCWLGEEKQLERKWKWSSHRFCVLILEQLSLSLEARWLHYETSISFANIRRKQLSNTNITQGNEENCCTGFFSENLVLFLCFSYLGYKQHFSSREKTHENHQQLTWFMTPFEVQTSNTWEK